MGKAINMYYTQQAIEKSIEGGFEMWEADLGETGRCTRCDKQLCRCQIKRELCTRKVEKNELIINDILMLPTFWNCLGIRLGWKNKVYYPYVASHPHLIEIQSEARWYFRYFCNHLWEGYTPEEFFEKILKENKND